MPIYKSKPNEILAVQFTGTPENVIEIEGLIEDTPHAFVPARDTRKKMINVCVSIRGHAFFDFVHVNDYVCRDPVTNEISVLPMAVFAARYELAESKPVSSLDMPFSHSGYDWMLDQSKPIKKRKV
jgi:hypothetical protein